MERITDIFVVGAPRAGTTTVASMLALHPRIYFSPIKEPHFFAIPDMDISRFRKKLRQRLNQTDIKKYLSAAKRPPMHRFYITEAEDYRLLFRDAPAGTLLAEASPSYLWSKGAAQRIKKENPHARIIIMLRNPVERAVSQYYVERKMGMTRKKLTDALSEDMQLKDATWGQSPLYVQLGLYCEQVERYLNTFGKQNIFIGWFDDLKSRTGFFFSELASFLGIEMIEEWKQDRQMNASVVPRFSFLNDMRFLPAVQKFSQRFSNTVFKEKIKSFFFAPPSRTEEKEAARMLLPVFEPEIRKLEKLLGKDLNHWLTIG